MEEIILEAQPRGVKGKSKVKGLRREGFIPAVLYGQDKDSLAIQVSHADLMHLIHQHRIAGIVVSLRVSSGSAKSDKKEKLRPCLIKEIQYDPVKSDIRHVDFHEISLTETVKVNVPVAAKGEPVGVKQEGGSLEHILWEIEVECLPTDIPKEVVVDVSALKIGDSIQIKDILFPPTIKVLNDAESTVLSIAAPIKEEEVIVPVEGEAQAEPEVIKEKKETAAEGEEEAGDKEKAKEKDKDKEKDKK